MNNKIPCIISVYFGAPGSGKSSVAAWLASKSLKKDIPVWSNFPISGCRVLNPLQDLGSKMIGPGHVIIDEAGIEYNNRDFKSFSKENNKFFKLHRHYGCKIDVFSQSYEDMDKKIRLLAQKYFLVLRSPIPGLVIIREIRKSISISEDRQIIDAYDFVPVLLGGFRFCWVRPVWRLFDSWAVDPLPRIEDVFY